MAAPKKKPNSFSAQLVWNDTTKVWEGWDGSMTLSGSDIEIGAVEIKDGNTDTRLDVESDGTKNAAFVQANLLPLPAGASTAAKQLPDGHNVTAQVATAVPESGTDAVGADAYATVLTPSTAFCHIMIVNEGANPATVSIDAGSTDTFIRVPTGVFAYDGVAITAVAIQAKNAGAGSNYANLTVTVW